MANRPATTRGQHSQMVLTRAQAFSSDGHRNVRADDVGWPGGAPAMIGTHIPDVSSTAGNGAETIVEVETCDSYALAETRSQWTAFASRARQVGGLFGVVVPQSCYEQAQAQAAAWGINVGQWWWDKRY